MLHHLMETGRLQHPATSCAISTTNVKGLATNSGKPVNQPANQIPQLLFQQSTVQKPRMDASHAGLWRISIFLGTSYKRSAFMARTVWPSS